MRASIRRLLSELTANDRPSPRFMDARGRPGIVLRPGLPNRPSGGIVNAAGLKKPDPAVMSAPVASARPLPTLPPVFERLPSTRAVYGVPELYVMLPESDQLPSSRLLHLPFFIRPCSPTGDTRYQLIARLWRWSKLDRPR